MNIILSRDRQYQVKDAVVVYSVEMLLKELKKYDDREVYVAGERACMNSFFPTVTQLISQK